MEPDGKRTIRLYHGSPERDFTPTFGLGRDQHDYGSGWRANASFFYIAKSFVRNNIGVDFLPKLLALGNLGVQYFVKSERAFGCLREIIEAREPVRAADYHGKYDSRDAVARARMYDLIENSPENDLSRTFKDIV